MADSKISQLTALLTAADDDLLAIVDTSATETKKIAKSDLVAGLQAELVSGTNIKTINSTSLLGSGDISISASPAGTAGQIQFSDGSAFAADSNLFWDNTNKRLGVRTSTPSTAIQSLGGFSFGGQDTSVYVQEFANRLRLSGTSSIQMTQNVVIAQIGSIDASAALHIRGTGSTSASTSLLVQNSSGTELLKVRDDGVVLMGRINYGSNDSEGQLRFISHALVYNPQGSASLSSISAGFEVQSTTSGFLPPRMTTTQKNAIASPASGLIVYDIDTNKLCCYNGTSWNDLF